MPGWKPAHDPSEVLRRPFDSRIHAETFIDYLEVVIDPMGKISYAVPSHQMALMARLVADRTRRSTAELLAHPIELIEWFDDPENMASVDASANPMVDFMNWLCEATGCVCVWTTRVVGHPNGAQREQLRRLAHLRLYKGRIPTEGND